LPLEFEEPHLAGDKIKQKNEKEEWRARSKTADGGTPKRKSRQTNDKKSLNQINLRGGTEGQGGDDKRVLRKKKPEKKTINSQRMRKRKT